VSKVPGLENALHFPLECRALDGVIAARQRGKPKSLRACPRMFR
jgi:hypothetical protein